MLELFLFNPFLPTPPPPRMWLVTTAPSNEFLKNSEAALEYLLCPRYPNNDDNKLTFTEHSLCTKHMTCIISFKLLTILLTPNYR